MAQARYKVGFVGLGKLGLPCASVMARYHDVEGYDVVSVASPAIRVRSSIAEVVRGKDLIFIAVPTPHETGYDGSIPISGLEPKNFDYSILKSVLTEISAVIANNQTVVVISTVLPGTMRRELAPLIPNANLIYNPYFIAMGTVESDFVSPEFYTIGTRTGTYAAADTLTDLYGSICRTAKFHVGTWEESEATKIFYNTYISFKIVFANMIQDVAERIGHMNVDRVSTALCDAKHRLISPMYLKAGMGDGGPCHPRDNIALRALSRDLELNYDFFSSILHCREMQARNLAQFLSSYELPVVIVGESYKPGVPYTDGSSARLVGFYLMESGKLKGYIDPLTKHSVEVRSACTYLISHEDSWKDITFYPGSTIVDPWRNCPPVAGCVVVHYGNTRAERR